MTQTLLIAAVAFIIAFAFPAFAKPAFAIWVVATILYAIFSR